MEGLPYTIPGGQQVQFTPYRIGGRHGSAAVVIGNGTIESEGFVEGGGSTTGWQIKGNGDVYFNTGTFRGELLAATGNFAGNLTGGTINIGAVPATSFQVDTGGNMFLGSSSYLTAPFSVTNAGVMKATSGTFTGDITGASGTFSGAVEASSIDIGGADATSWHVDVDGNMWSGATTYVAAPLQISNTGVLSASGGFFSGSIAATSGSFTGTVTAATFTGPGVMSNNAAHTMSSGNFVSGSAGWRITGDGDVEFNNGTFRGTLDAATITGGTIDIGGDDATSWHVDDTGFMWAGSNAAGKATAPFRVTNAGVIDATGATIEGTIKTAATGQRLEMGASGNARIEMYSGDGDEIDRGYIDVDVDNTGAIDFAFINVVAPSMTAGTRSYLDIRHHDNGDRFINLYADQVSVTGGYLAVEGNIFFTYDGTASSNLDTVLQDFETRLTGGGL